MEEKEAEQRIDSRVAGEMRILGISCLGMLISEQALGFFFLHSVSLESSDLSIDHIEIVRLSILNQTSEEILVFEPWISNVLEKSLVNRDVVRFWNTGHVS